MGTVKMKRQILIISLILLFIPVLAKAADLSYKEGELLVRFADPAASTQTKNNILNLALGCSCSPVVKEYSIVPGLTLAKIPASMTVEQARVLLTQSSNILYAEPNFKFKLFVTPNDTRFSELWGMNNTGQSGGTIDADIDAPEAWNMNTGSRSVIVAVTDLGVDYTHHDLSANMWVNTGEIPGNGVDDDGNGYIDDVYGYDTGDNDGDPMDDSLDAGHGTHVAGTIGAVGNNARGVTGVCWNVRIMAVKIADSDGVIFLDAILEGIQYAIDNGAKVINASWGTNPGYPFVTSLYDIINVAKNHGILFVAAAGNDYSNNNDTLPVWPASYNLDNIISVMATDNTDGMSYYSNYGPASVDISAPGGAQYYENDPRGILSTLPGNDYGFYQGTSMASPHVAGACALLLSADPGLTYIEVKQFLLDYSDRLSSLTGLCVSGGRLNLFNSLSEVLYDFTPPSPNPAEWEIVPQATGLHTIAMEAKKATDRSGVEYSFECSDASKNSGWQSSTQYARSDFNANTTYTFTVKYRDKSDNHNETGPSTAESATTAYGSDNLPPFPNPSRWDVKPKVIRLRPTPRIRMSAKTSSDEAVPVWYYFKCTNVTPAVPDPNVFSRDWNTSNIYEISSGLTVNSTYTFTVKTKDNLGNQTGESIQASVTVSAQGANILTVPVPYPTIQSAINASSDGDIVEVRPGTYTGGTAPGPRNRDLDFSESPPPGQTTRDITVRSIDPNDPSVIATTIIDCAGNASDQHRAFKFHSGEGPNSIVTGFTIINGWQQGASGEDGTGLGSGGENGSDANGAAIQCIDSSPTLRNCIIINCVAAAGNGGDGAIGTPYIPNPGGGSPTWAQPGGPGGNGGSAYGGGIYCNTNSYPDINNCEIRGCYAIGGTAGNGGNGGDAHQGTPGDVNDPNTEPTRGGNGGKGGSGHGGGIYLAGNNHAIISNSRIINNNTAIGYVGGLGGQGGNGLGIFPNKPNGTNGANGNAQAGGVYYGIISTGKMNNTRVGENKAVVVEDWNWNFVNPEFTPVPGSQGSGIYCYINSKITLTGCYIYNNEAIEGDGGGIWYEYGGTLTLNNCNVSGNLVPEIGCGGGIYAGHIETTTVPPLCTTVTINNNSTINGNEGGLGGGGMLLIETNLTLNDSTISDNNAFEGGGVWAYNCPIDVNNCTVRDNSAAELGGGLSIINGLATINNSYLTGNSAKGSVAGDGTGGALFFEGWSDYPHQVFNCLITDNNALSEGGGLSNNIGSWVQVTNCTFVGNEATGSNGVGGAISCAAYWAYLEIFNSILWDNKATDGGSQIAVGNPDGSPPYGDGPYADVDASYSDVQGGEDDVWVENETYTAFWWLGGNINQDPLFATTKADEQTYFLSQFAAGQLVNSPCVDAGIGDLNDPNAILGDYTTRTDYVADSGTVDMGYHYPILAVPKYQLIIEVINQGYGTFGTVKPPWTPGTYNVIQGKVVELHAQPDAGWEVYRWTGTDYIPVYPADPNYNTVTMNSDKTVTVEFGPRNAYKLVTHVIGNGTIDPNGLHIYPPGTVVPLTATPDNPSEVIIWTGTDDDFSDLHHNTVTMNAHKEVTVEFYAPHTLYVPAGYPTIQAAIDGAHNRDIIEISSASEPYYTQLGFLINGKAITITSTNPDDPCCVANTIIETDYSGPATGIGPIFNFNNVGHHTVLNGLTIRGYNAYGGYGGDATACGLPGGDGGWISGGGISCGYVGYLGWGNASPTIKNCIIADCTILGGDGGNGYGGCADNPAGGEGGWPGRAYGAAMACFNNSSPIFINCTFRNNIATGGNGGDGGNGNSFPPGPWGPGGPGGGWYYGEGSRWYNHTWPYGPYDLYTEYTGRGGAVYVGSGCSPEFIDCTFTNNLSAGGTNGICGVDGAPVSARYEPSIHYKIDNFGGAVFVAKNSAASFIGCTFNNNLSDTDNLPESSDLFVSFGGAIAFEEGADLIVEDCNFNGNVATIGGGIYSNNSDLTIDKCEFTLNSAFHGGGALFVGGTANINESIFNENEATAMAAQGGGLCCLGANVGITDCDISDNGANGSGGGIYISSKDIYGEEVSGENAILVKNCLITNNSASRDGGGISANWHSDPNIINCTIANNVVTGEGFENGYGGGLFCSYGNFTNIINSIIWDNSALKGPQLAIGTGYEYYPLPSTVDISYSDVKGGQSYVFIDTDCTLNWGAGNIHIYPIFVTGPLGNYYLSQIAAGQSVDSNCVNTGSGSAVNFGMNKYTTRTDEKPDRKTVDMGYHYPFTPEAQPCRFCELFRDGIINFKDFAVFALNWLDRGCNPANDWCQNSDVTFDTYVNYEDVELFAECWLIEDTYPPSPNPSEWEIEPYPSWSPAHPNSITMAAQTTTDAWDFWVGNVQYYFDCVFGGCKDSGWQNNLNYTDSNLAAGVEYGYRVRARDSSKQIPNDGTGLPGNKTGWSPIRYAIAGEAPVLEDHNPPTPNPMTWATAPYATSSTSIAMVATTATDDTAGVEYYFEDYDSPAVNSGWRSSPNWQDTTCEPETTYRYRVRARDTSAWHNKTGWSTVAEATTPAEGGGEPNVPDTNPPTPVAWEVPPFETGSGLNAYANMTAAEATDPEGNGPVEYYFECDGVPGLNSGWITDREWNNVYIGPAHQYLFFHFRVRDSLGNTSNWSTSLPCY
jgi:subtilisin family serine protease